MPFHVQQRERSRHHEKTPGRLHAPDVLGPPGPGCTQPAPEGVKETWDGPAFP